MDTRSFDMLQRPTWIFDPGLKRMVHANPAALELWQAKSLAEFLGRDISQASLAVQIRTDAAVMRLGKGEKLQDRLTIYPHGVAVTLETLLTGVLLPDGRLAMLVEARQLDLPSEEIRALEALRHLSVLVSLFGADGQVLFRNPSALAAYRERPGMFGSTFHDQSQAKVVWDRAWSHQPAYAEVLVRTAEGPRCHRVGARRTLDPATGDPCILVDEQDVSAEVAARKRIEHLATHDALTDLANRTLFHQRLDAAIAGATRSGLPFAVLMIDLDHFKAVNDTLGHAAGDAVLRTVAERLRANTRETDTLARLGGDEFGLLLTGDGHRAGAERVAGAVIEQVSREYHVFGTRVQIGVSIGIGLHDGRTHTSSGSVLDQLIWRADRGLYEAKRAGRNTFRTVPDTRPSDAGGAA